MGCLQWVISFKGMIYAVIAGLCSSSSGAINKLVDPAIHSFQVLIFRDIFQAVFCLMIIIKKGYSLKGHPSERKFILLRCIFGTISLSSWFISVRLTKFGDAGAIYYSYPAFIGLLALIFNHEPFGLVDIVATILTVIGIFFISGPHYITGLFAGEAIEMSHDDTIGVALASIACMAISCGNLSIRKLQKTPAPVVVVWFSLFSMTVSIIMVPILSSYTMPDWTQIGYITGVGIFGLGTQIFITMAFQLEDAGPTSIVESINMIYSYVLQLVLFNEPIGWNSLVGGLIILSAVLIIGMRKMKQIKRRELDKRALQMVPVPVPDTITTIRRSFDANSQLHH